jgi:hypothetical protein
LDLLEAIAGRDSRAAGQQLRTQTMELAAILREKQRQLEQRESELNARSALLESDLRAARLKHFREEPTAITAAARYAAATSTTAVKNPTDQPVASQPSAARPADELPPCEHVVDPSATAPIATPSHEEHDRLEQHRKILREREEKLERRQQHVTQLHEEVTLLHREALELRLASEQVWAELMEKFPSEQLSESMAQIRSRLADHYRLVNDTLAQRKDELHALRDELNLQEQRLRQQRRDVQMWADRRYDEIESRLAKIVIRERELDLLEGDFQRQSLQWQQQRQAYREEIEQLSWQLHERSSIEGRAHKKTTLKG